MTMRNRPPPAADNPGAPTDTVTLELTVNEAWFLRSFIAMSDDRIGDDAAVFNEKTRRIDLDNFLAKIDATKFTKRRAA